MIDISKHITMHEATYSKKAEEAKIKNEPTIHQIKAMQYVALYVFEPLRAALNVAILITSFFRCVAVNKLVGGSSSSQHLTGEAIDIKGTHGVTNATLFYTIIRLKLPFDQLIWEFGTDEEPDWVHVSLTRGNNRNQILKSIKTPQGTKYISFKPKL